MVSTTERAPLVVPPIKLFNSSSNSVEDVKEGVQSKNHSGVFCLMVYGTTSSSVNS